VVGLNTSILKPPGLERYLFSALRMIDDEVVVRRDETIGQYFGGVDAKRALLTLEAAT
jgi:hypothetical protein